MDLFKGVESQGWGHGEVLLCFYIVFELPNVLEGNMFIRKKYTLSINQIIRKKTSTLKPTHLTQKIKSEKENINNQEPNIHRHKETEGARDRLGGEDHCSDSLALFLASFYVCAHNFKAFPKFIL